MSVMDPLKAVLDFLFDVESWPTYFIYIMFVEEPNPTSVKKVYTFMFGNGVPIGRAVQCFNVCNELNSYYISHATNVRYFIWDRNPCKSHKAEYYSTFLKSCVGINGEALDQQEQVWLEFRVVQFGTESTGCSLMVKTTIGHVRSCTAI